MSIPERKITMILIGGLGICALLLGSTVATALRAHNTGVQQKGKVVDKDPPIFNEPVIIDDAKFNKRSARFGESFDGDKDWLKGAEIKLKNVSGREITFIEVDLNFPETQSTGAEMSYRINLGQIPGKNIPGKATLSLPPDAELNIPLDENQYTKLVHFVQSRHMIDEINKMHIRIGFVVFANGTAWMAGSFYRQDPNDPKHWVPIS